MALNQTKKIANVVPRSVQSSSPAKKLKLSPPNCQVVPHKTPNHPKVITITAEQFLALASRLQQQQQTKGGNINQPMIISLPKTTAIKSKVVNGVAEVGKKVAPKVTTLSEFLSSQSLVNSPSKSAFDPIKPAETSSPTSGPCLSTSPAKVNGFLTLHDPITTSPENSAPSPSDNVSTSVAEVVANPMEKDDTLVLEMNSSNTDVIHNEEGRRLMDEKKIHFFKSGQLKGSARTTPMTLLCRMKKKTPLEEDPLSVELEQSHQLTLNNAALPTLEADDDMLMTHQPDSAGSPDHPPVWLSIMEEENSQFSAGATENDDDLLDPTRLAAQLASIRQAASSQYSFSS